MLVYSTCTITPQENEQQVAWALKSFPCLRLEQQVSSLLDQCLLNRVSCLPVFKTKKKTPSVKDKKKMHNGLHSKVNDDFNFRTLSVDVLFFMKTFVSLSVFVSFRFLFKWLARKLCSSDHPTLSSKPFTSIFSSPLFVILFLCCSFPVSD